MDDFGGFTVTYPFGNTHRMRFVVRLDEVDQSLGSWIRFWFTAKRHLNDADSLAVIALTDGGGGITRLDPNADPGNLGKLEVLIPAASTSSLPNLQTALYADLQGKDSTGAIWTLAKGTIILVSRVTFATS